MHAEITDIAVAASPPAASPCSASWIAATTAALGVALISAMMAVLRAWPAWAAMWLHCAGHILYRQVLEFTALCSPGPAGEPDSISRVSILMARNEREEFLRECG